MAFYNLSSNDIFYIWLKTCLWRSLNTLKFIVILEMGKGASVYIYHFNYQALLFT